MEQKSVFRVEEQSDQTIIRIAGRFNVESLLQVNKLRPHADPNHKYIIDLSTTEFLDSSGMGMLLRLREHLKGDQHNMSIIKPKPDIRKLLEVAQFDKLFDIQ
ncbi:STAS domain-containing protein [Magnetofaba australis]|uniref:Putative anti-anti-sigma regulatory factor n=1 Tax=Magnetofaba australis IT-1 TaxID=1434232 RepID=A0A1Y2K3H3_9PROT|nr:STAS domain-containing protein [Magnetofaba australis]OSM02489.1 putative anti-anti-sigma regulatory factor [Magnetofaba australis IT-1]